MRKIIIITAVIIILLFLHTIFGILNTPNNFLINKTSFLNSFFYTSAINLKIIYENYKNSHQTSVENQQLKQQIENLTAQVAELQFLKQENQTLKENLNFLKKKEYVYISEKVFAQNFDSANRILMTSAGGDDGIKKDSPVIGEGGILIGVIEKVEPSYSLIKLLSDNLSQVSVQILNVKTSDVLGTSDVNSKSLGLLKGGFDLGMRIELVPQGEIINEGDLVVSSGLDKNIPANLLIGSVESVRSNPHEPFQTVFIKPATDYGKITAVSILID